MDMMSNLPSTNVGCISRAKTGELGATHARHSRKAESRPVEHRHRAGADIHSERFRRRI
jgi:hypothetical protein